MRRYVIVTIVVAMVLTAVSSRAEEMRIESLKAIAGTWSGVAGTTRFDLYIKDDGTYEAHASRLRIDGQITLSRGRGRYASSSGRDGSVTLHEEDGETVLRFIRDDGSLTTDFRRSQ